MRTLIPVLPLLLASALETYAQAFPRLSLGRDGHGHAYNGAPLFVDAAKTAGDRTSFQDTWESTWDGELADNTPKDSGGQGLEVPYARTPGGLEGRVKGNQLILDWAAAARPPAEFRILHPDGRAIASRLGKRSAQGWIAAVRVAGWPRGLYLAEVRSGDLASSAKILVP